MTKSAQINVRALQALSLLASTEETRYYLCGVCVEISARSVIYFATNGHVGAGHRVEVGKDDPDNTLLGNFIIPTAACKALKLGGRDLGDLSETGTVELRLDYLGDVHVFKPIDGTFPAIRNVVDRKVNGERAQFDADNTAVIQKMAFILQNAKRPKREEIARPYAPLIAHNGAPALCTWFDLPNSFAVIMPIGLKGKGADVRDTPPDWLHAPAEAAEPVAEDDFMDC